MSADTKLQDASARTSALLEHHRSLLVEAGAGSGKTAVMAGRVVMLLAAGKAPSSIAAVTFTELAAGELAQRVRDFAHALCDGRVPAELRLALPDGLSATQSAALQAAILQLDDLTCSTIHGFCQRLIMPYPVEAGIDPGASILAAPQADAVFDDLLEQWLREQLDLPQGGCLGPYLQGNVTELIALVRQVSLLLRKHRHEVMLPIAGVTAELKVWRDALAAFSQALDATGIVEDKIQAVLGAAIQFDADLAVNQDPAALLALLLPEAMFTGKGGIRVLRNKGDWLAAAKAAGVGKDGAESQLATVVAASASCCEALLSLRAAAAGTVLAGVAQAVQSLLERYQQHKRNAAQLDFDDLIFAARALLRDHEPVRQALAGRYGHLLVDEFQDTDALQAEIFWTLCGDAHPEAPYDWRQRTIRPGALFLVGDPKQAIYRFRGADIAAYVAARDAYRAQDPHSVLSIATNFRSDAPILDFVNQRFAAPLSAPGQPGFMPLDAFNPGTAQPSVVALDLPGDVEGGDAVRQSEADGVADYCQRLIGHVQLRDQQGAMRLCRAADIALLAPSGAQLWRYEAALEQRGIAVISQAGKGFYRQQEVQDLVALTRVLADARDTLALGALLRGPLVGLSDETLLDIAWTLQQRSPAAALTLFTDTALIENPLAIQVLSELQTLYRTAGSTTPALLLGAALDRLHVRHIVTQRHGARAERALANIEQFLDMAGDYAVRGLAAFAADVRAGRESELPVKEGARDHSEDAVTLFTMHASKGLEWPVVIPVNAGTALVAAYGDFIERGSGKLHCKVMGAAPLGYEEALEREKAELASERARLWYVALTRARHLLVLPRGARVAPGAWNGVVTLDLASLPTLDLPDAAVPSAAPKPRLTSQSAEHFEREARHIKAAQRAIRWRSPSRAEERDTAVISEESADTRIDAEYASLSGVRGSRERGTVIHKLLEEVVTGETGPDLPALTARAHELIRSLGVEPCTDPAQGMSAEEIAARVGATLALPEISRLLPTLQAEYPLWAWAADADEAWVTAGVADAVSVDGAGRLRAIIDWKSDVAPTTQLVAQYRAQVAAYVAMSGAERGLLVFVSTGEIIEV
jgi:exodeoxyribonuclease-5